MRLCDMRVYKDTGFLCVWHGLAGGVGLVAEEGDFQCVAVRLVQTTAQRPGTTTVTHQHNAVIASDMNVRFGRN